MPELGKQTAVVTGGAAGIGQEISSTLAAEGAHVVVLDIEDGSETVSRIEDEGGTAESRKADVTEPSSLESAFAGLDVDVLVNNAAFYAPLVTDKKRFDEIDPDEWDTVMDVNAKGVWLATKHALPHFDGSGSVVNIASNTAVTGVEGFAHYIASKAAVLGLTRAMATELGSEAIRVNAVMPGLTQSEASMQAEDGYWTDVTAAQSLDRPIKPQDIADAVTYLASSKSEMITGQALNVDGGFHSY